MIRTRNIALAALMFALAVGHSGCAQEPSSARVEPYFGQKPPGLVPEVFAPGVVSLPGRHEGAVSFSPALDEVYFNANNEEKEAHIYFSKFEDGQWSRVQKADLTGGQIEEQMHPSVTPDGKRLYFTALSSDLSYNKIWYADRVEGDWGEAKILDSPINEDQVFFPNQSKSGDLFYFSLSSFQTFRASGEGKGFADIEPVGLEFGVHASMAPSQDYIVLNARNQEDEDRNDNDLYVSFRAADATWGRPINLGSDINSTAGERVPTISPDGQFLFFGKDELGGDGDADIYWVSTQVIENLKPTAKSGESGWTGSRASKEETPLRYQLRPSPYLMAGIGSESGH